MFSVYNIGTNANFNIPWGIAMGQNNTIYVADYSMHRIRKIAGNFAI